MTLRTEKAAETDPREALAEAVEDTVEKKNFRQFSFCHIAAVLIPEKILLQQLSSDYFSKNVRQPVCSQELLSYRPGHCMP